MKKKKQRGCSETRRAYRRGSNYSKRENDKLAIRVEWEKIMASNTQRVRAKEGRGKKMREESSVASTSFSTFYRHVMVFIRFVIFDWLNCISVLSNKKFSINFKLAWLLFVVFHRNDFVCVCFFSRLFVRSHEPRIKWKHSTHCIHCCLLENLLTIEPRTRCRKIKK